MAAARSLPALLLSLWGIAFASAALGRGILAFDDHPGQIYRLAHVLSLGPLPWRFNPGWWAGYAELQFYPPGAAYVGALVSHLSLGALSLEAAYQVLVWIAYLLPGLSVYVLLARVLPSPWLALPAGFVALSLSAETRSGVEEGIRWGLIAARLGWGILPLLALSLSPWVGGRAPRPVLVAPVLLAATTLLHPSHAPAGIWIILWSATLSAGPPLARLRRAAVVVLLGLGLAGFWLVPLGAHLSMTRSLAWGDDSLGTLAARFIARPLLGLLLALAAAGSVMAWRGRAARAHGWLLGLWPGLAIIVALDSVGARVLGVRWLPADRLWDGLVLALLLGASVATALLGRALVPRAPFPLLGLATVALYLVVGLAPPSPTGEPTLTVRAQARQWPTVQTVARGVRLEELWEALRQAPPGRILYTRSAVPVESRPEWWRPHSHIWALTPLAVPRAIVNGTFTHPSPIAGFVYTGSAEPAPVTRLVEERDGRTLFGRDLGALTAAEFSRLAPALGVSTVVALDEDEGRLAFLIDNPEFSPAARPGPFRVFASRFPRPLPEPAGSQRWRVALAPDVSGWTPAGFAYSPLWVAWDGPARLPVRRDAMGMLEIRVPPGPGRHVELEHRPGVAEATGGAVSLLALVALVVRAGPGRRRR